MRKFLFFFVFLTLPAFAATDELSGPSPQPDNSELVLSDEYDQPANLLIDDGLNVRNWADAWKISTDTAADDTGMLSISLRDPKDLNWGGALDVHGSPTPPVLVLPFLQSYPIDNIEVKLQLLNRKF
ncbi:MAG: hypothetical protein FWC51_01585 [Proteobacteria bacterium]|nr:hypothetical protein [Pseudomonadota bacterium]